MRTYTVDVIQRVKVTLDETKFTPEFCKEYNETITYRGGDDGDIGWALQNHAEHLAWVHASGLEALDYHTPAAAAFVEGYGPAHEMGIRAEVIDTVTELSTP